MSGENPYMSPTTEAFDVAPPGQGWLALLFSFRGRAPRRVYWGVHFGMAAIFIPIALFAFTMRGSPSPLDEPDLIETEFEYAQASEVWVHDAYFYVDDESWALLGLMAIAYIPVAWILLAVGTKRWHDRDKSGWWILINLVPYIGGLWAFVEQGCLRGTVGANRYGPDPM